MTLAKIADSDRRFIREAAAYLEHPRFLMQVTNMIGKPVEKVTEFLPEKFHETVRAALLSGLQQVVRTIDLAERPAPENSRVTGWLHAGAAAATGAVSGFFGGFALAAELPVSTGIMLRSIATIARDAGEDLSCQDTLVECLTVLSQGGPSEADDAMENSYYTSRVALAGMTREAAQYLAKVSAKQFAKDVANGSAPAIVNLIASVATRFNVVVSQKFAAQAVPVAGAIGGAGINLAFTDHFNRVATFHFGLRRLERTHGLAEVQAAYQAEVKALKGAAKNGRE
jgi:hypothetical protein